MPSPFLYDPIPKLRGLFAQEGKRKRLKNRDARQEEFQQTWWEEGVTEEGPLEISLPLVFMGSP